jgi:hypothetical protein
MFDKRQPKHLVRPALFVLVVGLNQFAFSADEVDFNLEIRTILSNKCFQCHGPDENERQVGLRLDQRIGAITKLESGSVAIVPGKVQESTLIARILSDDPDERMPPASTGKHLTKREIELLKKWIEQGAKYAKHWSYEKPKRWTPPTVENSAWIMNDIDRFILDRLQKEKLNPGKTADRYTLIRRVSLDLTGLPPTLADVKQFIDDKEPKAYERLVDRLMAKSTFGEHWARKWLDLARYADSTGYADDPARTIWGYRDWVIKSINNNMPFDQFSIEQLAGDLLPNPSVDQLVATAFHRNTLTNNEGGTNDEEYRNVAIVDRVNTTMAVWMGTTIACAQCHSHKFDPITQSEYFQMFAIFNNSEDADRRNESPLVSLYTDQQIKQKADWDAQIKALEQTLVTPTPVLAAAQKKWAATFSQELKWSSPKPSSAKSRDGAKLSIQADGSVLASDGKVKDVYSVSLPISAEAETSLTALRLSTIPNASLPSKGAGFAGGNFVVTRVQASIIPPGNVRQTGRFVRIELPGNPKILSLAEVQVFNGAENVALKGKATQSSTDYAGPPNYAIDGKTDGNFTAKSTTHTKNENSPWWEVDLKSDQAIDRIVVWNRTDNAVGSRLNGFRISILDAKRQVIWTKDKNTAAKANTPFAISNVKSVSFAVAHADFSQPMFSAAGVLESPKPNDSGWAVGSELTQPHALTLLPASPIVVPKGSTLSVTIEQLSKHENHTLGHFALSVSNDSRAGIFASTPGNIIALIKKAKPQTPDEAKQLTSYFMKNVATELAGQRKTLADLKKKVVAYKPATSVPIMREMAKKRVTNIQHRGNYLDKGEVVTEGLPAVFNPKQIKSPTRLALAKWIVDPENPLTARVIANRYWEAIFGVGIVISSEEFGSQGELPSHPRLLDWLATELVRSKWDTKAFLKMLVTSAAYRQSSRVTNALYERDPDNRLLARGPRFRLSAEMIRDQALFVSGLLSLKQYGAPVRPPQPILGVKAAFGGGIDWKTSTGEDKFRRGLYTTWRRSNPYPSMVAFDAPNREVCTIRRDRTNTPLQALVTLNDPVFVEAAQALARRMLAKSKTLEEQLAHGLELCLSRPPSDRELHVLTTLFKDAKGRFLNAPNEAKEMATMPLGPAPTGSNMVDLAALTLVGNVLLNVDEMFMKR